MNVVLRAMRKAMWLSSRLTEKIEETSKREACCAERDVILHPYCRIENAQQLPPAIKIASRSYILGHLTVLRHGGAIRIGKSCFIGENSYIWSADSITIGNSVLISHNVSIHDFDSHSLSAQLRHQHFAEIMSRGHPEQLEDVASAPVVIEDDAWICFNATILKGVTIGKGAVVGAASVVTKDVPAYAIVVGNPARIVGESRA